jgi:uncharacterized cupredoxin-like copper-binding protein
MANGAGADQRRPHSVFLRARIGRIITFRGFGTERHEMTRVVLVALALLAFAGPAAAQSPERIEIDLSNFKFTPSTITLRHGQPYVLHFVNTAKGGHDFSAKAFFDAASMEARDRAVVAGGEIELRGGQTADVRLTAPAPGTYDVHCSHFMHSTFGMTGKIVVK